jgi:predicted site-specific integrase-resolvase
MTRRNPQAHIVVYPFLSWCEMRGISVATGRRLIAAGRVKATQLSARRIGIRSDHDQQYLDACLRDPVA